MAENELIVLPAGVTALQVFTDPTVADGLIERLRKEVLSVDRDISTPKGRENVASLAYKVARTKTAIDKAREALVSDQKKQLKAIDAEGLRIWNAVEALQKEVRQPLTEWEEANAQRVEKHEAMLTSLQARAIFTVGQQPAADEVQARLDSLTEFDGRNWEEFAARAQLVMEKTKMDLTVLLAERKKAEHDAAELKRLQEAEAAAARQRELDAAAEKARQEAEAKAAEEQARIDAENQKRLKEEQERAEQAAAKAAADAKAAEEKRLKDLADAEARRLADLKAAEDKAAAEKAAADARAKAAAEQAEADKQAAIKAEQKRQADAKAAEEAAAKKRAEDEEHKGKINREALEAIKGVLQPMTATGQVVIEEAAKAIVIAIAKGQIPHVKIEY